MCRQGEVEPKRIGATRLSRECREITAKPAQASGLPGAFVAGEGDETGWQGQKIGSHSRTMPRKRLGQGRQGQQTEKQVAFFHFPIEARRRVAERLSWPVVAVLTSSCAGFGPQHVRVLPTTVAVERLDRLAAVLETEWMRWGGRIAELPAGGGFCLDLPNGQCSSIKDGCGDEQTGTLCPVVNEYWLAVQPAGPRHTCGRTDVCETDWPATAAEKPEDTPAWSAVFVSAMMKKAGFSDSEFRPDINHAGYVVAARDGYASAFQVVPAPATVARGDLVCAMRGDQALSPPAIHSIADGSRAPPMHCDVVVHVDLETHTAEAIGGNVQQTVAKTRIALDVQNRVSAEVNTNRKWVLVLRARREGAAPPGTAPLL